MAEGQHGLEERKGESGRAAKSLADKQKTTSKRSAYVRHKKPPKRLSRRPNDIYINRASQFDQQLARCNRLLEQSFDDIIVHGLGMAIHRAINLALQLQEISPYHLQLSATTSTVHLVDEMEPLHDEDDFHSQSRPCSAIHIHLTKTLSSSSSSSTLSSNQQLPLEPVK